MKFFILINKIIIKKYALKLIGLNAILKNNYNNKNILYYLYYSNNLLKNTIK